MLKANVVMRRANITDISPHIRAFDLYVGQIRTHARANLRMETLEIREPNRRWAGTLGNINF
jgi:hypothetical protein